jgi:hypothetical protein
MTRPATVALLALASALAACGGAASEEPKAPYLSTEDLASPERAYAAVGRAEGELAVALGPGPADDAKEQGFAQPAPPPPPPPEPRPQPVVPAAPAAAPPAEKPRAEERDAQQKGAGAPAASGSPCLTACAALASMERAADHLCTLAGAGDARCADARARVKGATARVRTTCPACGG